MKSQLLRASYSQKIIDKTLDNKNCA